MNFTRKALERGKKIIVRLTALFWAIQLFYTNVYAAGIGNSKLFTGTKNLFKDLQKPLIGLSAVIAIVMILFNIIKMHMADDDADTKIYKKKIKIIICCAIAAVLVTSLLPTILSYFE